MHYVICQFVISVISHLGSEGRILTGSDWWSLLIHVFYFYGGIHYFLTSARKHTLWAILINKNPQFMFQSIYTISHLQKSFYKLQKLQYSVYNIGMSMY